MEASRPARTDDAEAVAELAARAAAELRRERGGWLWEQREAREALTADSAAALIADDDALVFVGTIDGTVVGFAAVEFELLRDGSHLGRLREIYVDTGARSVGVGEALIADVEAACIARGCVGIDAVALPGQRATKNFFEGAGFTARSLMMHRRLDATDDREQG
ncbi:MAG: GNAT family N-acetyltransferase [Acidimicrobiia bacterium]|nr:GNAT family N-acetyltransferase [Acidimicrobiia bacterium]